MMMRILLVTLNALVRLSTAQIDWCSTQHDCVVNGVAHKHTMCPDGLPVTGFNNITNLLTSVSRKDILRLHNEYRNRVAEGLEKWPKGANIRQMTWDNTLEAVATQLAMKCKPDYDVCRKTPEYAVVGQNIAAVSHKPGEVDPYRVMISDWTKVQSEVPSEAVNDTIKMFKDGSWSSATQIMWAETTKLGCGLVSCLKSASANTQQTDFRILVCNYAPGGNIAGHPIYVMGEPCGDGCPHDTKCKKDSLYSHLCSAPGDPTDDSLGVTTGTTASPERTTTSSTGASTESKRTTSTTTGKKSTAVTLTIPGISQDIVETTTEIPEYVTIPSVPEDITIPYIPGDTTIPSIPGGTTIPSIPGDITIPSIPGDITIPENPANISTPKLPPIFSISTFERSSGTLVFICFAILQKLTQ